MGVWICQSHFCMCRVPQNALLLPRRPSDLSGNYMQVFQNAQRELWHWFLRRGPLRDVFSNGRKHRGIFWTWQRVWTGLCTPFSRRLNHTHRCFPTVLALLLENPGPFAYYVKDKISRGGEYWLKPVLGDINNGFSFEKQLSVLVRNLSSFFH